MISCRESDLDWNVLRNVNTIQGAVGSVAVALAGVFAVLAMEIFE